MGNYSFQNPRAYDLILGGRMRIVDALRELVGVGPGMRSSAGRYWDVIPSFDFDNGGEVYFVRVHQAVGPPSQMLASFVMSSNPDPDELKRLAGLILVLL